MLSHLLRIDKLQYVNTINFLLYADYFTGIEFFNQDFVTKICILSLKDFLLSLRQKGIIFHS